MTTPNLPARGSTDWYDPYATWLHEQARKVAEGEVGGGLTAEEIAAHPTVMAAFESQSAEIVPPLVASAVAAEDILTGSDPRAPLLASFPGYLAALADADGNVSELALRDADGAFADWVLARWAPRLAPLIRAARPASYPLDVRGSDTTIGGMDTYVAATGELLPVLPNMTSWSAWGSSTTEGLTSRLATLAGGHGATSYNGSKGGERSEYICARLGSRPVLIDAVTIPASGAVTVTASNMGPSVEMRSYVGALAGVHGTLSSTADALTFTRTTAGDPVTVPAGSPLVPTEGAAHRADVLLLNIGKNDLTEVGADEATAREVIERTHGAFDYAAPLVKRVLVLGHWVNGGNAADSAERARIGMVNDAYAARYGAQFLDLGAYVTGDQVWTDTGITPTADDLAEQALGNKPPSISADYKHLNAAGYDAVAALIAAKMTDLGWIS